MPDITALDRFPDGPLAAAWDRLVLRDPSATVFHSGRFLRLWCRHLRGDCDLNLRFVLEDGAGSGADRLLGVVPEIRERAGGERTVRFAGGSHVTDYLGPISAPHDRDRVADAWIAALVEDDTWDHVIAAGLAEDAGWHRRIARSADAAGLTVTADEREDVCPRVGLEGGWDGYLDRLSSKHRHEIRRKARKLAREGGVVKLVDVAPDALDQDIDRFVELHRTAAGEKGRFFVDDRDRMAFFHALAREFGPDRTLRIHRLDLDGRPAAIALSLVWCQQDASPEWGLYNSAFDREFGALAPGMVLAGELIRIAAEEGHGVFDLLRGDEPYKFRFGARGRGIRRVEFRRP